MLGNPTGAGAPRTLVSRWLGEGIYVQPELTISRGLRRVAYVASSIGRQGFGREAVHVPTVPSGRDEAIHVAQSGEPTPRTSPRRRGATTAARCTSRAPTRARRRATATCAT